MRALCITGIVYGKNWNPEHMGLIGLTNGGQSARLMAMGTDHVM